jgi:DNA repair exonuclease SbcCD ATPase subunit
MLARLVSLAAIVALAMPTATRAQQSTASDKTQDARLDALEKQLAALTTRVTTTEGNVTDIDRRIAALTSNVETLTDVTKDIDSRLKTLDEKVNSLTTQSNSELTTMKKQLGDIARKEGDSYVPNISAAMNTSDKFRQEMETVVNRSLKPAGALLLANKTMAAKWVYVNKTAYFVRPGEQIQLNVNVGTITTQLPGEEMQTWSLTAPTYQLSLDMVPTPPTAAGGAPVYSAARYMSPPGIDPLLGSAPTYPVNDFIYGY